MMIWILFFVAALCILIERRWPAAELPRVHGWWARVILVNLAQLTWDKWLARVSLFHLQDHLSDLASGFIAYFVSTFVYYWWHRFRHESRFFWRLCHQLHHSVRRIEVVASFYKHPVEILINSI